MQCDCPTTAWEAQNVSRSGCSLSHSAPSTSKLCKKPRERWTKEEHELFLEGLKRFHRDWRAIERHVGTKTAVQIRSHAQKFFVKAEKVPGTVDFTLPPPRPKRKPANDASTNPVSSSPSDIPSNPSNPSSRIHAPPITSAAEANQFLLCAGLADWRHELSRAGHVTGASSDMMNKIAAAAIAAASSTAHAVINAAGPEYLQVISELAQHDERLRFLTCPLPELVSRVVAAPQVSHCLAPATSQAPAQPPLPAYTASTAPFSGPEVSGAWHPHASVAQRYLSGFLASSTISPLPSAAPLQSTLQQAQLPLSSHLQAPLVSAISNLTDPNVQLFNHVLAMAPKSQQMTDWWRAGEHGGLSSHDLFPSASAPQRVPGTAPCAAVPNTHAAGGGSYANAPTPAAKALMAQQQAAQAQQQGDAQFSGIGQQGSRGGFGGENDSGGSAHTPRKNNDSGKRSDSKSAKQSDNATHAHLAGTCTTAAAAQPPCPTQAALILPKNLDAMNSEFYMQYYTEMILRGKEGLRNMNKGKPPASEACPSQGHVEQEAARETTTELVPCGEAGATGGEQARQQVEAPQRAPGAKAPAERILQRPKHKIAKLASASGALHSIGNDQPSDLPAAHVSCAGRLSFFQDPEWRMEVEQHDTGDSWQGAQGVLHASESTQRDSSIRTPAPSERTACMPPTLAGLNGSCTALDGSDGGSNEPTDVMPCADKPASGQALVVECAGPEVAQAGAAQASSPFSAWSK